MIETKEKTGNAPTKTGLSETTLITPQRRIARRTFTNGFQALNFKLNVDSIAAGVSLVDMNLPVDDFLTHKIKPRFVFGVISNQRDWEDPKNRAKGAVAFHC